ncbi:hypothetical protein B0T10DRAFT_576658 [Thelonectria olida]|uniref:Uncharacterized protein n=1 Tax=Thelonectria olida TaxID=1576542 RepID=A0A9P8W266_9HYPO|nr:hypothetical protein B0T10DRAFT_576658 [Thelonectria olida]
MASSINPELSIGDQPLLQPENGPGEAAVLRERDTNLDFIANMIDVAWEDLKDDLKKAYTSFKNDYDYVAFYKRLEEHAESDCLSPALMQYPDYRAILYELYGQYDLVAQLCGTEDLGKMFEPPASRDFRSPSPILGVPEKHTSSGKEAKGHANLVRPVTDTARTVPFLPYEIPFNDPPSGDGEHPSGEDVVMTDDDDVTSSSRAGMQSPPDVSMLGVRSRSRSKDPASEGGWRAPSFASGLSSSSTSSSSDARDRESPRSRLKVIKNFLSKGDIDNTPDWNEKFIEIRDYLFALDSDRHAQHWLGDLDDCLSMLLTHEMFEQYHYGKTELVLDFPNPFPAVSKRLPPIPGPTVTFEGNNPNELKDLELRDVLVHGGERVHDSQYGLPDVLLKDYVAAHHYDTLEYWGGGYWKPHRLRAQGYTTEEDRFFNMASVDNGIFDQCIKEGMSASLKSLMNTCRFKPSPSDIPAGGIHKPHVNSLRSFSRFRGARRAGLQQCLNMFDSAENRIAVSPWRCVRLPDRSPPMEELLVSWEPPKLDLSDVSPKDSRDPYAYTMAHKWYVEQDQYWGRWEYKHAVKETWSERAYLQREAPPMALPENFKGPYYLDDMDKDMKEIHTSLQRYKQYYQRLLTANNRAPRSSLAETLECIKMGLRDEGWESLAVTFEEYEFAGPGELAHIRPDEEPWLYYLGEPSKNEQMLRPPDEATLQDRLHQAFEARVQFLMNDSYSEALFRDMKPVGMDEFIMEVNQGVRGLVKRHTFSMEEGLKHSQVLAAQGKLTLGYEAGKEVTVGRPTMSIHPENRIRWPQREVPDENMKGTDRHPSYLRCSYRSDLESDQWTISTHESQLDIPESKDLDQPLEMPLLSELSPWAQSQAQPDPSTINKTNNFLYCLAYRFGKTMRDLKAQRKKDRANLTDEQKEKNKEFLRVVTNRWEDEARRRPNNSRKNKYLMDDVTVTPRYTDVVRMAEPEKFSESWRGTADRWKGTAEAIALVGEGLVREVYENKSLLLPNRAITVQRSDGPYDYKMREPIWTFAHPQRRRKARQFWDMNRWPLHLQSDETQAEIRASGPKPDEPIVGASPQFQPFSLQARAAPQAGRVPIMPQTTPVPAPAVTRQENSQENLAEVAEEIEIPFSNPDVGRRNFRAGDPRWYAGNTPQEKAAVEARFKERFEDSTPKPPLLRWQSPWRTPWKSNQECTTRTRAMGQTSVPTLPELSPTDVPVSMKQGGAPRDGGESSEKEEIDDAERERRRRERGKGRTTEDHAVDDAEKEKRRKKKGKKKDKGERSAPQRIYVWDKDKDPDDESVLRHGFTDSSSPPQLSPPKQTGQKKSPPMSSPHPPTPEDEQPEPETAPGPVWS